ncbi:outer membrane lipoprotein carrier protein LolA [Candidatus Sumerlaeota bacterium]|nr:outer membrane lipoprotein carrier protein LolA [Candidatus Sumerlaeota bacterium]
MHRLSRVGRVPGLVERGTLAALLLSGVVLLVHPVSAQDEGRDAATSLSLAAFLADDGIALVGDALSTAPTATEEVSPSDADAETRSARTLLGRIEARHGGLKTLRAEFDQILITELFGEEIASRGDLCLQPPDRLRCDYFEPDPATLLFVKDTMYVHIPKNESVDKFTYSTEREAQQHFRMVMLGFGVSSEEILKSYRVTTIPNPWDDETSETAMEVLDFEPLDPDLAKSFKDVVVGFDSETLLPRRVRLEEAGGEVRTLTIRRIVLDDPIGTEKFEPSFPGNPEIVEHRRAARRGEGESVPKEEPPSAQ